MTATDGDRADGRKGAGAGERPPAPDPVPPRAIGIASVNRSPARALVISGRNVLSGFRKQPVLPGAAVAVRTLGLEGDEQADLSVHGGPDKAVYGYPHEHYPFWQAVRARTGAAAPDDPLAPGALGENLTLTGVLESELWIGDRLHLPGCVLAVSGPRFPCFKLDAVMGFRNASQVMVRSGFCGVYFRVIEPGVITPGDRARLQPGPRQVNLRTLFQARARA